MTADALSAKKLVHKRATTATVERVRRTRVASAVADHIRPILVSTAIGSVTVYLLSLSQADPDLWGHVRFGIDTLRTRSLAVVDPYSFTSDRPWVNHEWLAEVLMAVSYSLAGPIGLALLKFAVLCATFVAVDRALKSQGVELIGRSLLTCGAALASFSVLPTIRPQVFSLMVFAMALGLVARVRDRFSPVLWWLPVLMLAWVNLHGGWLVGIGTLGLWLGARSINREVSSRDRLLYGTVGLAMVAASLLNPYGFGLWRFLWDTVEIGRTDISEWQPLTNIAMVDRGPWIATVAFCATVLAKRRDERRAEALVVLAVLAFVSFRVWRVGPFFSLAAVIFLGPAVFRRPHPTTGADTLPTLAAAGTMFVLFSLFVAAAAVRNLGCVRMSGDWIPDVQAARFIESSNMRGRMITWFGWGEYAIWRFGGRLLVSMDGRRETVYSPDVIDGHQRIYSAASGAEEYIRQLNADYAWLPAERPPTRLLRNLGWNTAYASPRSVVLERTSKAAPVVAPAASDSEPRCFPGL